RCRGRGGRRGRGRSGRGGGGRAGRRGRRAATGRGGSRGAALAAAGQQRDCSTQSHEETGTEEVAAAQAAGRWLLRMVKTCHRDRTSLRDATYGTDESPRPGCRLTARPPPAAHLSER